MKAPTTTAAAAAAGSRAIDFLGASHRGGKIFVEKLFGGGARHTARALSRLAAECKNAPRERESTEEKKWKCAHTAPESFGGQGPWCSSPYCRSLPSRPRFALDRFPPFFLHIRESNGRYVRVVYHTRSAGIRV